MVTLLAWVALAQAAPTYDVYRTPSRIAIDGKLDERAWRRAAPAGDFHFNWRQSGDAEQTVVKLLWDDRYLYAGYFCHDKHISASVTQRNGPVSNDDCVELFVSPNPGKPRNYYGFEINAIGTMLHFSKKQEQAKLSFGEPAGVRHRTSFHGWPEKKDSPGDDHWILELAVPWKIFSEDAAHTPPRDGDRWRLNLNRAGGVTNPQYSTWSPVSAPKPNFHVPESFGWVRFVKRKP
ncbi:MAG: carbohydrate-binding family 9-like protein [Acidobacteria bacterium]|nr:carbohydrate-binding family 9-like protein [Acidobacteriota bacterium]